MTEGFQYQEAEQGKRSKRAIFNAKHYFLNKTRLSFTQLINLIVPRWAKAFIQMQIKFQRNSKALIGLCVSVPRFVSSHQYQPRIFSQGMTSNKSMISSWKANLLHCSYPSGLDEIIFELLGIWWIIFAEVSVMLIRSLAALKRKAKCYIGPIVLSLFFSSVVSSKLL